MHAFTRNLAGGCPTILCVQMVVIEDFWASTIGDLDVSAPPAATRTSPEGAAYIEFTSGSTGRPKGVTVPHRALTDFLCWARDTWELGPQDVSLLLISSEYHSPATGRCSSCLCLHCCRFRLLLAGQPHV